MASPAVSSVDLAWGQGAGRLLDAVGDVACTSAEQRLALRRCRRTVARVDDEVAALLARSGAQTSSDTANGVGELVAAARRWDWRLGDLGPYLSRSGGRVVRHARRQQTQRSGREVVGDDALDLTAPAGGADDAAASAQAAGNAERALGAIGRIVACRSRLERDAVAALASGRPLAGVADAHGVELDDVRLAVRHLRSRLAHPSMAAILFDDDA